MKLDIVYKILPYKLILSMPDWSNLYKERRDRLKLVKKSFYYIRKDRILMVKRNRIGYVM